MELLRFEKNLYDKGIRLIAGVDEVGRGPLAGPMVVASVILNIEKILGLVNEAEEIIQEAARNNDVTNLNNIETSFRNYKKINDSKKVSQKNRELLDVFIREEALSYSIIEISSEELDNIGISAATQKCFYSAITNLKIKPEHVLTDSFEIKTLTKDCQTNIIKGDSNSISIAAASIIAKVYRDALMESFHEEFPQYGFNKHKGYGTKFHLDMIETHGPCAIHRKSFSPIREMVFS